MKFKNQSNLSLTTKILLIEDNKDQIFLIKKLSNDFNLDLDVGNNKTDFLNLINKKTYDIIICDIDLDYKFEGLDILEIFKKSNLKGKIYAFTSSAHNSEFFLEKGFHGFIEKSLKTTMSFFRQLSENYSFSKFENPELISL
jgi:CheY-like chemotaxis protein